MREKNVANNSTTVTKTGRRFALVEDGVMILLILFSLIGIALMNFSPQEGFWYWVALIPVFGASAMLINYSQAKRGKHVFRDIVVEQSLLWLGALLALCGTLLLLHAGTLTEQACSLVMLLVLSLATYIDGLKIGWRFSLVGNFLGLTAVIVAFFQQFMWILFVVAAATIGLTLVLEKRRSMRKPAQ